MSEILSVLQQDIRPTVRPASELGARGERLAAAYLAANGYRLIMRNFKVPIGRNSKGVAVTGEIDIVALDGDVLCFVEVKARRSADFAEPIAAVTRRKQRQIIRTSRIYVRIFGLQAMNRRYDVVSLVMAPGLEPEITITKGFWSETRFRKRSWSGDIH